MSAAVQLADTVSWWTCCGSTDDWCECMEAAHCPECGEAWEHCECDHDLEPTP
jgi:hypothetical protein